MSEEPFDDLLRRLAAMLVQQQAMNERLDRAIDELRTFNARQLAINQDVSTTLARLETLLARLLRPEGNGREA